MRKAGALALAFFSFQTQNLYSIQYKRASVMRAYELGLLGASPVNEVAPFIHAPVGAHDCPVLREANQFG